jgi:hypothetical protein
MLSVQEARSILELGLRCLAYLPLEFHVKSLVNRDLFSVLGILDVELVYLELRLFVLVAFKLDFSGFILKVQGL